MPQVFSFIAYSNTGKTTYVESLIRELKALGLRVGAMKHDAHEFEIDKEGKDSWRFARAGADIVAVASATKAAIMEYRPVEFNELLSRMKDVDIIIVEGWHSEAENKICLWRSDCGKPMKLRPEECVAVVSDVDIEGSSAPVFPLNGPKVLADWLYEKIKQ